MDKSWDIFWDIGITNLSRKHSCSIDISWPEWDSCILAKIGLINTKMYHFFVDFIPSHWDFQRQVWSELNCILGEHMLSFVVHHTPN